MTVYRCDRCKSEFFNQKELQSLYMFDLIERKSEIYEKPLKIKKDLCQDCVVKVFEFINKGETQ